MATKSTSVDSHALGGCPVCGSWPLATPEPLAEARGGRAYARGDVVLAGAVTAAVPLTVGTSWRAVAEGFDAVAVPAAVSTTDNEEWT